MTGGIPPRTVTRSPNAPAIPQMFILAGTAIFVHVYMNINENSVVMAKLSEKR